LGLALLLQKLPGPPQDGEYLLLDATYTTSHKIRFEVMVAETSSVLEFCFCSSVSKGVGAMGWLDEYKKVRGVLSAAESRDDGGKPVS